MKMCSIFISSLFQVFNYDSIMHI